MNETRFGRRFGTPDVPLLDSGGRSSTYSLQPSVWKSIDVGVDRRTNVEDLVGLGFEDRVGDDLRTGYLSHNKIRRYKPPLNNKSLLLIKSQ